MSKTAKNFASTILMHLDATTEIMLDAIENSEVFEPVPHRASLDDRIKYIIGVLNNHDPEVVGFNRSPYSDTSLDELCSEFDCMLNDIRLIDAEELREADVELSNKLINITQPLNDLRSLLRYC